MAKMFGNLTTEGAEKVEDRVGGFTLFETDVYEGIVKLAYVTKSTSSESQAANLVIDIGGREYRETIWMTNSKGENTYQDKKDPAKKHLLPGFISINDLAMMTTETPLSEQDLENKVVEIYDFEARKAVPTNVPVFVDMLGKPVKVAIQKRTVDKQKKDGNNVYQNTGETRDENTIVKFFHPETDQTLTEAIEGVAGGTYMNAWLGKNQGKTYNAVKGAGPNAGAAGRPGANNAPPTSNGAGAAKPKTSLFGAPK